jgi:hypothetical protein
MSVSFRNMIWKKILRFLLFAILVIIGALILFIVSSIAPIDRAPEKDDPSYALMMKRLSTLDTVQIHKPVYGFRVGYSKINLTPTQRTATAGYGNRKGKLFTSVLDSIYVRTMVVDNGARKVAIVSADLLIIPPTVTERLKSKLSEVGFSLDNTYLGATHTHNSIGNWGEGATRFIYGAYSDSIVNFIADKIAESIIHASANGLPAKFKAGVIAVPKAVHNRLIEGGPEDSLLRVIEIHRSDSSKLLFLSYTAHATCLRSRDLQLSRDYPGKLVDIMESHGYDFAMFMAGAVGSHGCDPPAYGENCIEWMANEISKTFLSERKHLQQVNDSTIAMVRVPLGLSDPQVKISSGWKVRSWLFRSAFGEYPVSLTALRLGKIVLLGIPGDFSGEFDASIDALGAREKMLPIITSFNGGYIGYVTPVKYYDVDHYETQLMNWYAPGTGEYIEECLKKLIDTVSK